MDVYRELRKRLKAAYPNHKVCVLRTRVPKKLFGDCAAVDDGWRIRICKSLNDTEACDTLIHEFAHVPSWDEWVNSDSHGKSWAWHYAKCYRIYESIATESHARIASVTTF